MAPKTATCRAQTTALATLHVPTRDVRCRRFLRESPTSRSIWIDTLDRIGVIDLAATHLILATLADSFDISERCTRVVKGIAASPSISVRTSAVNDILGGFPGGGIYWSINAASTVSSETIRRRENSRLAFAIRDGHPVRGLGLRRGPCHPCPRHPTPRGRSRDHRRRPESISFTRALASS